jgi:hypothetical protein
MTDNEVSALPDAFYLPRGDDEFDSTVATTSPWDETMQHAGPPAALLARAVERVREDEAMKIGRLTVDMLGPIPQGRMRTEATIVRPGKRIELVEAKLWANDRLAVTATAWRMRSTPDSSAEVATDFSVSSIPGPQEQLYFPGISPDWGYGRAIEWRFVTSGLQELGPADAWVRPRIPLVSGEETSPVQRFAIVADSANGISATLPFGEWTFIPTSLSLTFARDPRSEWLNMNARTHVGPDGRGVTDGDLADEFGYVGAVSQPLVIGRL